MSKQCKFVNFELLKVWMEIKLSHLKKTSLGQHPGVHLREVWPYGRNMYILYIFLIKFPKFLNIKKFNLFCEARWGEGKESNERIGSWRRWVYKNVSHQKITRNEDTSWAICFLDQVGLSGIVLPETIVYLI